MRKFLSWAFILPLLATLAYGAEVPVPAEAPPVTKVVLYKHGMGYIEREGKIKDNTTLSMAFRADQMKDLLTSFFAVDLGGGKVSSVQYETRDPLSKQLQDIPIDVPEQAALSRFFAQLKGARLAAKAAGETVEGRILGIEPLTAVLNNHEVQKGYRLVLLTDAGTVRSLDLFAVVELALKDEALQRDLVRLLDLSAEGRNTNRKKLTVSVAGQGERALRMGYLIEMPIWKCSYRVLFDAKKKDDPPLLQGWALAENTTEDDWRDIAISFVAGNPLSYSMDLYSPYYVNRPKVPIPGLQNLAPDWSAVARPDLAEDALAQAEGEAELKSAPGRGASSKAARKAAAPTAQMMDQGVAGSPPRPSSAPLATLLASNYDSSALGAKIGELFSYESKEKVTIMRGQAAMVPIVSKQIGGRRVLYYKAALFPRATNAFVLRNDTDLTLEAGSVVFFEGGTSLGESILAHTLPPGSQEILPYAMDASVDATPQQTSHREPHYKARLVDGVLTLTCVETITNTWKILNRGKESATLWLDQPKNVAYHLSKPEKPLKEVDNHYRFEVPLKAGETVDFLVEEKRDVQETVQLGKASEDQIRFYLSQSYLSAGAKAFMKELSDIMAQKAALQRQINEWTQQTQRLNDEQGRLRSNLESLKSDQPKEQELRAKWVASLAANEDQLMDRRAKLDDAGVKLRQLDESLARKIREYKDQ